MLLKTSFVAQLLTAITVKPLLTDTSYNRTPPITGQTLRNRDFQLFFHTKCVPITGHSNNRTRTLNFKNNALNIPHKRTEVALK